MKINELLAYGYNKLKEADIDTYMLDTQLLLCRVLNVNKLYLIMNRDEVVSDEVKEKFDKLIEIRATKKPIAYILGEVEFMGINFFVEEGVLIPRPDTEILVEECIKIIKNNNIKNICDMCCGSGAIGLSIAELERDTMISSYDISDFAIETTTENIKRLGLLERVNLKKSNLFEAAISDNMKFEMIVSNPPYIEEDVIPTLMSDVKDFEPHLALSGGKDGLIFYRKITEDSVSLLEKGGYLCFEIGYNQEREVSEIMADNGFINIYSLKDLAGNFRVVVGQLP